MGPLNHLSGSLSFAALQRARRRLMICKLIKFRWGRCTKEFSSTEAQRAMNKLRDKGFRVRMRMGNDLEYILDSWDGF